MNSQNEYDRLNKQHYAADIARIENLFLEQVQRYIDHQMPYINLVRFCVDHVLNQKATRFIDREMYDQMREIAVTLVANTVNEKLENLLKRHSTS